jgi:hypothetical protein
MSEEWKVLGISEIGDVLSKIRNQEVEIHMCTLNMSNGFIGCNRIICSSAFNGQKTIEFCDENGRCVFLLHKKDILKVKFLNRKENQNDLYMEIKGKLRVNIVW